VAVLADTAAHESGHSLGLVHESYLAADDGRHNPAMDASKLMNRESGKYRAAWLSPRTWMPVNLQYLRFVLPTP
jgi:hypothetical protein